jgi:hypothetical protein
MMWIYDLPTWLLGMVIVEGMIFAAVGAFFALHRAFSGLRSEQVGSLAMSFIGIVCAFHSLVLAFSAVLVWQNFQNADAAVAAEAGAIEDLYRDLRIYGTPQARKAGATLLAYTRAVVEDEWPLMARRSTGPKAAALVEQVFEEAGGLAPKSSREEVVFAEIFRTLNRIVGHRHVRIWESEKSMPGIFWAVTLLATALLFAYTGLLPPTRLNAFMVAGMSAAIGLVFFFIVAFDHPFVGDFSVDAKPLQSILERFDKANTR